ncbi:hypothetical protein Ntsu_63820 [Nocardia sp. IFM 10818]
MAAVLADSRQQGDDRGRIPDRPAAVVQPPAGAIEVRHPAILANPPAAVRTAPGPCDTPKWSMGFHRSGRSGGTGSAIM